MPYRIASLRPWGHGTVAKPSSWRTCAQLQLEAGSEQLRRRSEVGTEHRVARSDDDGSPWGRLGAAWGSHIRVPTDSLHHVKAVTVPGPTEAASGYDKSRSVRADAFRAYLHAVAPAGSGPGPATRPRVTTGCNLRRRWGIRGGTGTMGNHGKRLPAGVSGRADETMEDL